MRARRTSLWCASAVLCGALTASPVFAVCGDGVWEEDEPCDDGNDVANDACNGCRLSCERVAVPLTTHTCGHGANGPFESMPAQSYPGVVFSEISATHTYFTLSLSGEPGMNQSAVLYAPGSDGQYPFYLKERYPLAVYSSKGALVPLLFEHEVTCVGAPGSLTWVKVYELVRSETYTVVLGPSDESTAALAVEYNGAPTPRYWDRDGDQHGGALAGLSGCEYDEPTVDVGGDCDDDDASIHPGATEVCDGVDRDCSGDPDPDAENACGSGGAGGASGSGGAIASDGGGGAEAVASGGDRAGAPAGGSRGDDPPGSGGERPAPEDGAAPASDEGCSYGATSERGSAALASLAALSLALLRRRRRG